MAGSTPSSSAFRCGGGGFGRGSVPPAARVQIRCQSSPWASFIHRYSATQLRCGLGSWLEAPAVFRTVKARARERCAGGASPAPPLRPCRRARGRVRAGSPGGRGSSLPLVQRAPVPYGQPGSLLARDLRRAGWTLWTTQHDEAQRLRRDIDRQLPDGTAIARPHRRGAADHNARVVERRAGTGLFSSHRSLCSQKRQQATRMPLALAWRLWRWSRVLTRRRTLRP